MSADTNQQQVPQGTNTHDEAIAALADLFGRLRSLDHDLAELGLPPVGKPGSELKLFARIDRLRKALEQTAERAKGKASALNQRALDALAEVELQNAPLEGGVTVYSERTLWAGNVKASEEEDADAAYSRACRALEEAGLGEYVQTRYNVQSLSAYFREEERRLEAEQRDLLGLGPDDPVVVDPDDLIPEALRGIVKVSEKVIAKAKQS